MQVWAANGKSLIGQVTKFSQRSGKLTIEITDPEVVQELVDGERIGLTLTMQEIRRHHERQRDDRG